VKEWPLSLPYGVGKSQNICWLVNGDAAANGKALINLCHTL
jgi:hypothetical protein